MRHLALLTVLAGLASPRIGHAEDEEFLLGDVGVRIDLPAGWAGTHWTDAQFKAETRDKSVVLSAWATPFQTIPVSEELPLYGVQYAAEATRLGLGNAEVLQSSIADRAGTPVARASIGFDIGGGKGRMEAVSLPVEGHLFHLAVVSSAANSRKGTKALEDLLARLDVRRSPAAVEDGGVVEASGIRTDLPAGWPPWHRGSRSWAYRWGPIAGPPSARAAPPNRACW
jgi:hypothetical protein